MDQRTESLKQEIDQTRNSMTEKMEQIESQVYGTVDTIKETATETVDQVKHTLDVKRLVNERPWTMLGASVLTGFVLGSMVGGSDKEYSSYSRYYPPSSYDDDDRRSRQKHHSDDEDRYFAEHPTQANASNEYRRKEESESLAKPDYSRARVRSYDQDYAGGQSHASSGSGIVSSVQDQFGAELTALKQAAIASVTDTIRSLLQEHVPRFAEEFERARHEREHNYGDSDQHGSSPNEEDQDRQAHQQADQPDETPAGAKPAPSNGEKNRSFQPTHQTEAASSSITAPAGQRAER